MFYFVDGVESMGCKCGDKGWSDGFYGLLVLLLCLYFLVVLVVWEIVGGFVLNFFI